MRRTTRGAAVTGLGLLAVGSLFAGVAGAAAGYRGEAKAEALHLRVAGKDVTTSSAVASVDGLPHHAKAATGEALVDTLAVGAAAAEAPGGPAAGGNDCRGGDTVGPVRDAATGIPGVTRLDLTCGKATASTSATGASASALGAQVVLEPGVSGALAATPLGDAAGAVPSSVAQAINPLVQGLTGTPVGELVSSADATLQEVVTKVLTLKSTARIVVGPAFARTVAGADKVTSTACAQGVRVELLPVDETGPSNGLLPEGLTAGEPIVTITVGSAYASRTAPTDGGSAQAEAAAAPVVIHFATTALAKSLGLGDLIVGSVAGGAGTPAPDVTSARCAAAGGPAAPTAAPTAVPGGASVVVPIGTSQCLFDGTPLKTCVKVASASVDADGNPSADGVTVQLLDGQVDITTGRVTAGNGVTVAAPAGGPAQAPSLPRTGAPDQLAVLGTGIAAVALVTRRLLARA